jgi:hypothetical protein
MSDPGDPEYLKGDFWPLLPQPGATGSRWGSDREGMEAQVERAEARLLDHCANLGRWLDDAMDRTSATGRLYETLDVGTISMLRRGLGTHVGTRREGLRGLN